MGSKAATTSILKLSPRLELKGVLHAAATSARGEEFSLTTAGRFRKENYSLSGIEHLFLQPSQYTD